MNPGVSEKLRTSDFIYIVLIEKVKQAESIP